MLIYPATIVLLVGNLFDFGRAKRAIQTGVIIAIVLSVGDFLTGMGFDGNFLSSMTARFPLAEQGMAWLVPALVGAAIAFVFSGMSRKTA